MTKPMPIIAVVFAFVASMFCETPEQIVRQVYAKAVFAHQVYLLETGKTLVDNRLMFQLSDFQSGPVVGNQQAVATIYASTAHDALQATLASYTWQDEKRPPVEEYNLQVEWLSRLQAKFGVIGPVKVVSPALTSERIGDLTESFPWATTYVTYNVTVTFQGRSASARAFWIFGDGQAYANDPLLQNTGLNDLITKSVYPTALLQRSAEPEVGQWLHSVEIEGCPSEEVCCVPSGCGLQAQPQQLSMPIHCDPDDPGCGTSRCTQFTGQFGGDGPMSGSPVRGLGQHTTGSHNLSADYTEACSYGEGPLLPDGSGHACIAHLFNSADSLSIETGITGYFTWHSAGSSLGHNAGAVATYPDSPHATSDAAAAIQSCHIPYCPTVSLSWNGVGFSFSPLPYWSWPLSDAGACPATRDFVRSPIVIDLNGDNFERAFTSRADGIMWDFFGSGHASQMAWTSADANIGYLVLDRNGNGVIDNGKELFGNLTKQPYDGKEEPNGFVALAVFDRPRDGGNGNGKIDPSDAVWSKLRVWVDTSHTGDSRQGELYTLGELHIKSIPLQHVKSTRTDRYGNHMQYQGVIERDPAYGAIPYIYDVFFTAQ